MTNPSMAMPSRRVELEFAATADQNRVTVLFRIILAIPQIIILYFLFIAAFFVVVIGWFGALFTGQLPRWAYTYLSGVIRWSTRVGAYLFLLTDQYPPFSFEDLAYPVRPILPESGPLNRVTVLFRIFVAIPAFVFYQIVQNGLTFPLLIVMWFVVLITGRMPPSLYDPYMALLRYEIRFHAWFSMITSEYAWGMMGDTAAVSTGYTPPPFVPPGAPSSDPAAPPNAPPAAPPGAQPPVQPPAQPYAYPSASGEQAATPPPESGSAALAARMAFPPAATLSGRTVRARAPCRHPHRGAHRAVLGRQHTSARSDPPRRGPLLDDRRHRLGFHRVRRADRPKLRPYAPQHHDRAGGRGPRGRTRVHPHRRAAFLRWLSTGP